MIGEKTDPHAALRAFNEQELVAFSSGSRAAAETFGPLRVS